VLPAPFNLPASTDTDVDPDIIVLRRHFYGRDVNRREPILLLVLTIEVHSPAMARLDRTIQWQLQMARGVAEYWIMDVEARPVRVH